MTYKILDLFSGAGGFSLGLDRLKQFETVLATDFDVAALETFQANFPEAKVIHGDITDEKVKDQIISQSKKLGVNMVIGGPPCQGFSNKGKMLGLKDPRNFLFQEFLHIVKNVKPDIFMMENVRTMVTAADRFFIKAIKKEFEDIGYIVNYDILRAYDFGVPQRRERAFVIGTTNDVFNFDKMDHADDTYTVKDAISDLNYLQAGEGETVSTYKMEPQTSYQKEMRQHSTELHNHVVTRHTDETLYKLSLIPPEKGKEYLPEKLRGNQKFKTTWSRLVWDEPSPTIDTRFETPSNGKNSHPVLDRAITPREAARIQSFPDDFVFYGNRTNINTQIGNAVPPKLAEAIGRALIKQIRNRRTYKDESVTLYNDDAYDTVKLLTAEGIKVDHIITDPPFAISKKSNFHTMDNPRHGVYFGDWDNSFDLYGWIGEYAKLLNKDGSFVVFCSYRFISYIIDEMEAQGLVVKDIIRWNKTNPMPRNIHRRYVQDTEFAIWAVNERAKWVFNKPEDVPYLRTGFDYPVVSGRERTGHPTQKSLRLMEKILEIHTNEGQTVLDPFMGSGTTGVAAKRLNRKFIGIELDEQYFDLAKDRLKSTEPVQIALEFQE